MIRIDAEKSPVEDFPMNIDFGKGDWGKLYRDDPIGTVVVTDWEGNALTGITVAGPAVDPNNGLVVQFRVSAGTNNTTYYLKVKATSQTNAYVGEAFIKMAVGKPSTT